MAKDDLANLRLDLAPKLNRPLSLWNPLDYLRLLFWVFYFPQGLEWYTHQFWTIRTTFSGLGLRNKLNILSIDRIQQNLLLQGLFLTIVIPISLIFLVTSASIIFDWNLPSALFYPESTFFLPGNPEKEMAGIFIRLESNTSIAERLIKILVISISLNLSGCLFLNIPFGISFGISFGIIGGFLSEIVSFQPPILIFILDGPMLELYSRATFSALWGIAFGMPLGIAANFLEWERTDSKRMFEKCFIGGFFLGFLGVSGMLISSNSWGNPIWSESSPGFFSIVLLSGLTGGLTGGVVACTTMLRPDSWLMGSIFCKISFKRKAFFRISATTYLTILGINERLENLLKNDWSIGLRNILQLWTYTNQCQLALNILDGRFNELSSNQLFMRVAQFSQVSSDWKLFKCLSTSASNRIRLDTPLRTVAAGFWYLHEEQPAEAAQAFAVVRDIRHGEEMHGLASLLALFDAAETTEQMAAIELPDLPRDRTLRPHTWEAIRRFCHVVSDTKTAQASASRTARAFATNRALGELQHIIEYEADLPEAERGLVIEIAKTWRNALLDITAEVGEINLTQPVQNPYVIGDPVEGDLFVGRDDIMRQLQELWLLGNHLQSVVIYGHRRMGKTSILKNIESRLGAGIHVAYVNLLKSAGADNLSDVLLAISDQVATTLAIAPPSDSDMETSPSRSFERFWRRATASLTDGKGLIIALDEFEKIEELIEAGKLEASFMAYLRGLVQDSPRVGFAFAGLHTLQEMSADYFQPFFASVIPIKVDFFKPATVQTLLPNPGGDFPLDYDYDALDLIWALTAGQPYLTQLIGFQLVRRYNDQVFERQQPRDPKFTVEDVQAVVNQPEFFTQGKPYFHGVWAQAGHDAPGQQAMLAALAPHPDGLPTEDLWEAAALDDAACAAAVQTLENHDVVRQDQGQVAIIVEVFRRWVLRDYANRSGRIDGGQSSAIPP